MGRQKRETDLQILPSEAREHRRMLGEMTDSEVVQASLDGDAREAGALIKGPISYDCNVIRNGDTCQTSALKESIFLDGCNFLRN